MRAIALYTTLSDDTRDRRPMMGPIATVTTVTTTRDDDDDDDDDDERGHGPDYKRMCAALLRALASGRRNSPLKFVVKFPTLDANGMPRSNDLDVIDVSVM